MEQLYVAWIGITCGVLLLTFLPILRKMKESRERGEGFKWNHDYTITAVITLITCSTTSLFLLTSFKDYAPHPLLTFAAALNYGFSANAIVNEIKKVLIG